MSVKIENKLLYLKCHCNRLYPSLRQVAGHPASPVRQWDSQSVRAHKMLSPSLLSYFNFYCYPRHRIVYVITSSIIRCNLANSYIWELVRLLSSTNVWVQHMRRCKLNVVNFYFWQTRLVPPLTHLRRWWDGSLLLVFWVWQLDHGAGCSARPRRGAIVHLISLG